MDAMQGFSMIESLYSGSSCPLRVEAEGAFDSHGLLLDLDTFVVEQFVK